MRVVLRNGSQEIVLTSDKIRVREGGTQDFAVVEFDVPQRVLLGVTEIRVERPAAGTMLDAKGRIPANAQYVASKTITIDNKGGFAFAGDASGVQIIDLARKDEGGADLLVGRIELGAPVTEIVVTTDLGSAFVATQKGIAIIDTLTLQQYDADFDTPEVDMIEIPGGVTTLAVDPNNRYLYVGGLGKVYIIDIDPGSATYLQLLENETHAINVAIRSGGEEFGHITSMAINADGTRLYVGVPVSEMYGPRGWTNYGKDHGLVMVINVDDRDRPKAGQPNARKWREVIGKIDGGVEVYDIQATAEADKMVFVSRGDTRNGVHLLSVTNNNPINFQVKHVGVAPVINEGPIGVRDVINSIAGIYYSSTKRVTQGQIFDLDIRNAAGIAVTPDLSYMFVADWGCPSICGTATRPSPAMSMRCTRPGRRSWSSRIPSPPRRKSWDRRRRFRWRSWRNCASTVRGRNSTPTIAASGTSSSSTST